MRGFVGLAIVGFGIVGCGSPIIDEPPAPSGTSTQSADLAEGAEGGGGQNHTGGADARDAGHNPDAGAFGASCATGLDCESNVCFSGGKGGFCSVNCTGDTDCPAGADNSAPHCNPHGYCRY